MKMTINVDATPEELRAFFGLPDVSTVQAEIMEKMKAQMLGQGDYDPAALLKAMAPEQLRAFEALQQQFWQALFNMNGSSGKKADQ